METLEHPSGHAQIQPNTIIRIISNAGSDRQGGQGPTTIIQSVSEHPPDGDDAVVLDPQARELAAEIIKQNAEQENPANIVINIAGTEVGAMKRARYVRRKRTMNDTYHGKRSGKKFWARRFVFGKDQIADENEREKRPLVHFVKQELGRHLAEFIGAFFLVFFVTGIQLNQNRNTNDQIANIDKGVVSGFILTGLIFCFGHVSGAHLNPCVTFGFFIRGAFGIVETLTYIIVQLAGSISASAVLYGIFSNEWGLGANTPRRSIGSGNAFGIEIIITFILITVILTTAQNVQVIGATSGIAVGFTFGSIELFAWNFTGGSCNPWRSLAPTIISGEGWPTIWIYIVGPVVGTILAIVGQRIMINGISRFETAAGGGHNRNSGETADSAENRQFQTIDIKRDKLSS